MEYETYPSWVPNLDGYVGFVRKLLPGNELMWFERTLIYAAKVRNASMPGSQAKSLFQLSVLYGRPVQRSNFLYSSGMTIPNRSHSSQTS